MFLLGASRPGGAECMFALHGGLRAEGIKARLVVEGHAAKMAAGRGAPDVRHWAGDPPGREALTALIRELRPSAVAATLLGDRRAGLDRALLKIAKSEGIKTLGVLDSWANLADRLLDDETGDPMGFLPDTLAVMDESAASELARLGVPREALAVTGQPAFDAWVNEALPPRGQARAALNVGGEKVAVFFSEPIRELGMGLGFDQYDAVETLARGLDLLKTPARLLLKRHPVPDGAYASRALGMVEVAAVADDAPLEILLGAADGVFSISSTLLARAALAGKLAVAVRPAPLLAGDPFLPARDGLFPVGRGPEDVARFLRETRPPDYSRAFPLAGRGVENLVAFLKPWARRDERL